MKEKFKLSFADNEGRSADLELCVFCDRVTDIRNIGRCEYFADGYKDNKCHAFIRAEDTEKRINEALDIKCGKNARN